MSTDRYFEQMLSRFNPAAAGSLDAVFQYRIEDPGANHPEDQSACHFIVKDQQCVMEAGEHDAPSVTMTMNEQTLGEILSGETDGMQAFMSGQLKASGDLMLATRVPDLFPAV